MKKLKRAYKVEINPTDEQKCKYIELLVYQDLCITFILLIIKKFMRKKESL